MKTNYRYILRYPDGSTEDVFASNLKSLLLCAYQRVRFRPDVKAYQLQIKSNIDDIRDAIKFYTKTNKELSREKASRQKAIEAAAKTKATSNQNEDLADCSNEELEPAEQTTECRFKHLGVDINTPIYKIQRLLADVRRTHRRWREAPPNKSIYVQRQRLEKLEAEISWLKQLIQEASAL